MSHLKLHIKLRAGLKINTDVLPPIPFSILPYMYIIEPFNSGCAVR